MGVAATTTDASLAASMASLKLSIERMKEIADRSKSTDATLARIAQLQASWETKEQVVQVTTTATMPSVTPTMASLDLSLGRETTSTTGAHKVFDAMPTQHEVTMSSVIHVSVSHVIYPVTEVLLRQVFEMYGYGVTMMALFQGSGWVEASVQLQSGHEAVRARDALHGRNIYDGCCNMSIKCTPAAASSTAVAPSLAMGPNVTSTCAKKPMTVPTSAASRVQSTAMSLVRETTTTAPVIIDAGTASPLGHEKGRQHHVLEETRNQRNPRHVIKRVPGVRVTRRPVQWTPKRKYRHSSRPSPPPRPPDWRYTSQEKGASLPPSTHLSASRKEPRCSWLWPMPTRSPDQCKLGLLPVSSRKTNGTVNTDGQVALASQPRSNLRSYFQFPWVTGWRPYFRWWSISDFTYSTKFATVNMKRKNPWSFHPCSTVPHMSYQLFHFSPGEVGSLPQNNEKNVQQFCGIFRLWDPGIIQWPLLHNLKLDETSKVKRLLVLAMGWYVTIIFLDNYTVSSNHFSSTGINICNNSASCENRVSVGIDQPAVLHLFVTAHLQHIAQVGMPRIRKFVQLEALQRACPRYTIAASSFPIWNFSACALLFSTSSSDWCFTGWAVRSVHKFPGKAFYLPGSDRYAYFQHEDIWAKVDLLTFIEAERPFSHYSLQYCRSSGAIKKCDENLSELLMGDQIDNSSCWFCVNVNEPLFLCTMKGLHKNDAMLLKQRTHDLSKVNMMLDNLPVMCFAEQNGLTVKWTSLHVGYTLAGSADDYSINHLKFEVLVQKYEGTNVEIIFTGEGFVVISEMDKLGMPKNIPWDPGIVRLKRLEGKPEFKGARMSCTPSIGCGLGFLNIGFGPAGLAVDVGVYRRKEGTQEKASTRK